MKTKILRLFSVFWLLLTIGLIYYLLVEDRALHLSISDIIKWASHCPKNGHILLIGLLPIYLGAVIFGISFLFLYLRSSLWSFLSHYLKRCLHISR
jgi:hypothetical protein